MLNWDDLIRKMIAIEAQTHDAFSLGYSFLNHSNSLLEAEAIVTQIIQPGRDGQVKFQGSWWKARCSQNVTLVPGTIVYVVDRCNVTTLYVETTSNYNHWQDVAS